MQTTNFERLWSEMTEKEKRAQIKAKLAEEKEGTKSDEKKQKGKKARKVAGKVVAGQEIRVKEAGFKMPKQHQAELNLHGYFVEDALMETEKFLRNSKVAGYKKVLVITGKGMHSAGGLARLRPLVGRKLVELLEMKMIRDYEFADGKNGGFGAYFVYF